MNENGRHVGVDPFLLCVVNFSRKCLDFCTMCLTGNSCCDPGWPGTLFVDIDLCASATQTLGLLAYAARPV